MVKKRVGPSARKGRAQGEVRRERDKEDEYERERRGKITEKKQSKTERRKKMTASARLTRSVDLRAQ